MRKQLEEQAVLLRCSVRLFVFAILYTICSQSDSVFQADLIPSVRVMFWSMCQWISESYFLTRVISIKNREQEAQRAAGQWSAYFCAEFWSYTDFSHMKNCHHSNVFCLL